MDQTNTVDNDLQKAIDDITNTTNVDPVFSDPVAAPSSVPEGDTGELAESVGPFPEPKVEMVPKPEDQIAPIDPVNIPNLNMAPEAPAPAPEPPIAPEPIVTPEPPVPDPVPYNPPESSPFNPSPTPLFNTPNPNFDNQILNTRQVKEAALRDLVPLLGHLNMAPSQKFNLYRNIFESLRDYTILEAAYRAATEISNVTERAEALLYLIESIDRM